MTRLLVYLWAPFANLLWYLHTVVMATLSLLVWPFDRTGEMQHWCARWWCRLVAWSIFARIHVHGTEHVRPDRAYVYMANHASLGHPHPDPRWPDWCSRGKCSPSSTNPGT